MASVSDVDAGGRAARPALAGRWRRRAADVVLGEDWESPGGTEEELATARRRRGLISLDRLAPKRLMSATFGARKERL